MTNQAKNVPELRFPEFDGEWEEKKLGDLASVTKLAGFEFTKHIEYSDFGEIPAIRGLNVKHGGFVFNDVKYIDNSDLSKLSRSKLDGGNIVYTYVGTIGDAAIVPENKLWYLAPNVAKIVTRSIKSKFLLQILLDPNFKKKEVLSWITTSSQPALSMSNIRKFKMNIPKSSIEQEKIGEFFSKLDRQIELEEQKLAKLEEQKKGYMQKIFSQELRFKDENGSEYQRWTEGTIKSLVHGNISDGDWIEKEHISKNGKYRIIQTGNIGIGKYLNKEKNSKFINQKDYDELKANEIYSGDILISRLAEPAGRSIIMPKINWPMVTSVDVAIIRPNNLFDPYFLISMLNTDKKLYDISKFVSGSSHKRISRKNLEKIKVICPEIREQQKIGNFFRKIDKIIEKQSNKIELLKERKQGFLQKMFV
ncbi:restriction endonuclease subunit S [Mammaliicoccus fleurettii]|nr:restriction endonuclease subunit S [Mammaliicoccus fleurettii]